MFDHSIRVPRLYKTAAQIVKKASDGNESVKSLVYERKHPNVKAVFALVVGALQRSREIESLIKKAKLLEKEPRFDPWLAKILITELLWGKKRLPGESKPIKTILAYEQIFKAHDSDFSNNIKEESSKLQDFRPRFVRVNTLKTTTFDIINEFRNEEWVLVRLADDATYEDFLERVKNLKEDEFIVDFHISDLLVFPHRTQFHEHELYKNGSIILQDKASCLPIHILNPTPGSIFLDMCASPGMKTTQAAALMKNKGQIFAVEIDKDRFNTLNKIIESSGVKCVKTIHEDVLALKADRLKNIQYILVDPSCSGSGINRINIGNKEEKPDAERLQKLAGFQIKILRHALNNFPDTKRVVYSTCSLYSEENEDVVRQVLETNMSFKLVDARNFLTKPWNNVGSPDYGKLGECCIYSRPESDLSHGFFVAVFERLQRGEKNEYLNTQLIKLRNKGRKSDENKKRNKQFKSQSKEENTEINDKEYKKKNRKYTGQTNETNNEDSTTTEDEIVQQEPIEEPKKKRKNESNNVEIDWNIKENENDEVEESKKKSTRQTNETNNEELTIRQDKSVLQEQQSKKKKKEKGKNKEETNESSSLEIDLTASCNENEHQEMEESKNKKKKRKNVEIVWTTKENENDEVEESKKKRKSTGQTNETHNEDLTTTQDESVLQEQVEQSKEKKKKRKNKEEMNESSNLEIDLTTRDDENEHQEIEESERKKKKRKNGLNNVEIVWSTKENENNEVEEPKKKRKSTGQTNETNNEDLTTRQDEIVLQEQVELSKEKKKKRKNKVEMNESSNLEIDLTTIRDDESEHQEKEESKRKKKERKNESNNVEIDYTTKENEEVEEPKKKKKKSMGQTNELENVVIDLTTREEENEQQKESKKKRKNMVQISVQIDESNSVKIDLTAREDENERKEEIEESKKKKKKRKNREKTNESNNIEIDLTTGEYENQEEEPKVHLAITNESKKSQNKKNKINTEQSQPEVEKPKKKKRKPSDEEHVKEQIILETNEEWKRKKKLKSNV